MALFGTWVEELIEESITLWAAASSESLFTQLCFPLSFELQIGNPVGLPVLMKTEFWMKCSSPKVEHHTEKRAVRMQRQGLMTEDYSDLLPRVQVIKHSFQSLHWPHYGSLYTPYTFVLRFCHASATPRLACCSELSFLLLFLPIEE